MSIAGMVLCAAAAGAITPSPYVTIHAMQSPLPAAASTTSYTQYMTSLAPSWWVRGNGSTGAAAGNDEIGTADIAFTGAAWKHGSTGLVSSEGQTSTYGNTINVSQYALAADDDVFDVGATFTLLMIFKPQVSVGTYRFWFSHDLGGVSGTGWTIQNQSTDLTEMIENSGVAARWSGEAATVLGATQFMMISQTSGCIGATLFKNGTAYQQTSGTLVTPTNENNGLYIFGRDSTGNSGFGAAGYWVDFAIWKGTALSTSQMTTLYNKSFGL